MLSKEERAAIETRVEAATEGAWHKVTDEELEAGSIGHITGPLTSKNGGQTFTIPVIADDVREEGDAEFIAHARTDIPLLLAALAGAERERDEAQAKVARAWDEGAQAHKDWEQEERLASMRRWSMPEKPANPYRSESRS